MNKLQEKTPSEVSDEILIDYKITGGYNENAVEVFWKIKKKMFQLNGFILRHLQAVK
ncbi:hypothetical protein [Clostridium saccharobutylicum]|uniref:hypothetical protein n=1 Tax=Clostridium saccharobutylicum TaxID=169679 RepID=UPI001A9B17EE|nr:hypothetical protein [Clostridium saccharobutylicum]NOV93034.1 hypothetical protein [Clostridium saccharobutylicum]